MTRGRNTLVLLVLGAAMGAYVYFVEMKREPASEASAAKPKIFGTTIDATKIEELQLKSSSGERTSLKKTGTTWQIVSPIQSGVDDSEVTGVTSGVATLEASRTIDENAKDLAKYGLAEPRIEVSFKAEGDKEPRRLLLGAKTPTGGDLYAKVASDAKVVLVPAYLESSLDRTTFQLRDKSILKFDRDTVDTIDIAAGATTMTFKKQGETWLLTQPYQAKTDSTAVESLIGRIASGQMKALTVQDPAPPALTQYGLTKPEARITLGAGSARMELLVGKAAGPAIVPGADAAKPAPPVTPPGAPPGGPEAGGDGVYAKDASRPIVFTIDKALGDDLAKGPADYRKKDLFDFREFTGTRLDVTRGGATVTFEKKKEAPQKDAAQKDAAQKDAAPQDVPEKWVQTQPAKAVDAPKIEDLASKVASLRADSFVDKLPAGATELLTIATQFEEGKKSEKVVVYKAGADYLVVRPDDAGAAKIPAAGAEDIVKALDALAASTPGTPAAPGTSGGPSTPSPSSPATPPSTPGKQ